MKESLILAHYAESKAANPGAVLLLRTGAYYNAFGPDALRVAQTLGLACKPCLGTVRCSFPTVELHGEAPSYKWGPAMYKLLENEGKLTLTE